MGVSTAIGALLLALLAQLCCAANDETTRRNSQQVALILAVMFVINPLGLTLSTGIKRKLTSSSGTHRNRKRKTATQLFGEAGPCYVRRAYRMDEASFWALHRMLYPYLRPARSASSTKNNKDGAKNGIISSPIRLSAAIRYMAGGRPDDIAASHGISHTNVFRSLWRVVDAVNKCPELAITFPVDHEQQYAIAAEFKKKSAPGFDCCVGCIDGILIWIEKPNRPSRWKISLPLKFSVRTSVIRNSIGIQDPPLHS